MSEPTLDDVIRGRRSIRRYRRRDVPDELIEEILDLCRYAPSSMNGQPWCFVVVRSDETKKGLAEAKKVHCPVEKRPYAAAFIETAPVVAAVCVKRGRSHGRERENGVLAAAHLMLAAHGRGLGSVYLTAYQEEGTALSAEIRNLLGLPAEIEPIALIPLGSPDESPGPKELRPLAGMIHHERFDDAVSERD